ncbi:hypothetical protein [Curtobacterium sp. MCBA15_008]|uniref:hypothetical protein n=1 Tax=Curtobacterium sp. MCBA15_008 TaxID=1898736 RepID=UPI0008DD129A|nr:hypothetical protein [Curtobacterium sp. MCBA15_008]OII12474.1 hypothetical protein BIU96_16195 [Curtobacterium sp. MCBA15_008]
MRTDPKVRAPRRGVLALALALVSLVLLTVMWPVVNGADASITEQGDGVLLGVILGFAGAVISGLAALIIALTAIITDRGRTPGVIAAAVAVTGPITASGLASALTL